MKITETLFKFRSIIIALMICSFFASDNLQAAGISIDAGLTPSKGRWMVRTQFRQMYRENDMGMTMKMNMRMHPLVIAHGLRSDLTLMARQAYMRNEMTMGDDTHTVTSGFGDLLILAKYRILRENTPNYTLGIAPTLGLELPTGEEGFTSDTWDIHAGFFFSLRKSRWGLDLNLKNVWNGSTTTNGFTIEPGNEFVIEAALDHRFGFGTQAQYSIAPILEATYLDLAADRRNENNISNTGERVTWLSPGLIFTWSSFIVEGLVRIPVSQELTGMQPEHQTGFIIGIRLMN